MEEQVPQDAAEPSSTIDAVEPPSDVPMEDTEHSSEVNETSAATDASTRRTRWSSAIMSGIDPRLRFANRRFSDLYDHDETTEVKKVRRTRTGPKMQKNRPSPSMDVDQENSEDDCDPNFSADVNELKQVLKTISDVVTSLIPKIRFTPDAVQEEPVSQRATSAYSTRSTSSKEYGARGNYTEGAGELGYNKPVDIGDYIGVCDDLQTVQRDVEDLLNRNIYQADERIRIVVYSTLELIAHRANNYYRTIQNMECMAQYAWRTKVFPVELITALIDIYRSAALEHLEYLRTKIPLKLRYTGVLDFRPWREGFCKVEVNMQHVNAILAKYDYIKIRDTMQVPPSQACSMPNVRRCTVLQPDEATAILASQIQRKFSAEQGDAVSGGSSSSVPRHMGDRMMTSELKHMEKASPMEITVDDSNEEEDVALEDPSPVDIRVENSDVEEMTPESTTSAKGRRTRITIDESTPIKKKTEKAKPARARRGRRKEEETSSDDYSDSSASVKKQGRSNKAKTETKVSTGNKNTRVKAAAKKAKAPTPTKADSSDVDSMDELFGDLSDYVDKDDISDVEVKEETKDTQAKEEAMDIDRDDNGMDIDSDETAKPSSSKDKTKGTKTKNLGQAPASKAKGKTTKDETVGAAARRATMRTMRITESWRNLKPMKKGDSLNDGEDSLKIPKRKKDTNAANPEPSEANQYNPEMSAELRIPKVSDALPPTRQPHDVMMHSRMGNHAGYSPTRERYPRRSPPMRHDGNYYSPPHNVPYHPDAAEHGRSRYYGYYDNHRGGHRGPPSYHREQDYDTDERQPMRQTGHIGYSGKSQTRDKLSDIMSDSDSVSSIDSDKQ
ncbi:hypothetical protein BaOVIS_030680 [Babesia ovis]|uniref:Uncharacterized protein n=1 Tax=Babesia ovis TaxID=5869 RepID=A0A9W5WW86_BABOV|nr:hypothetical protein BaOVIS_030680 [Babesia ovis]